MLIPTMKEPLTPMAMPNPKLVRLIKSSSSFRVSELCAATGGCWLPPGPALRSVSASLASPMFSTTTPSPADSSFVGICASFVAKSPGVSCIFPSKKMICIRIDPAKKVRVNVSSAIDSTELNLACIWLINSGLTSLSYEPLMVTSQPQRCKDGERVGSALGDGEVGALVGKGCVGAIVSWEGENVGFFVTGVCDGEWVKGVWVGFAVSW